MKKKKNICYQDNYLKKILTNTKSIAIVGLSDKENRPSYFAAKYLKIKGYKIIPINPLTKSKTILDEKVYKNLNELSSSPDMVDLFVNQEKIADLVSEAIKISPKTIWLQLGLIDFLSEKKAKKNGINFVMDRCPKIEYARLSGELSWAGISSGVITNRRIIVNNG